MTQTELVKYFKYLDGLRERGTTNMYGARPYLTRQFSLDGLSASQVLSQWMLTFSDAPAAERATEALKAITS